MVIDEKMKNKEKNTSYKALWMTFLFVLMFSIAQIGLVSSADWDNVKGYDEATQTITIKNAFGLPFIGDDLAKYTLIENTYSCMENCYSEGKVTLYTDAYLFQGITFIDKKGKEKAIKEYNFYYLVSDSIDEERENYYYDCNVIVANGTICQRIENGTIEKETITYSWKKYQGEVLVAGTYDWRIEGKKEPFESVDWVASAFGVDFDEWAWWNGNYDFKRKLYINNSGSATLSNMPFLVNGSGGFDFGNPSETQYVWTTVDSLTSANQTYYTYYDNNSFYAITEETETTQRNMDVEWGNMSSVNEKNMWRDAGLIMVFHGNGNGSDLLDATGVVNVSLINQATTQKTNSVINYAYEGDGANDCANLSGQTVPSHFDLVQTWTMSFWFRSEDLGDAGILGATDICDGDLYVGLTSGFMRTAFNTQFDSTNFRPNINTWYHFTLVGDSGTRRAYVNGLLNDTVVASTAFDLQCYLQNSADFRGLALGASRIYSPCEASFNGQIDEFRIYNETKDADWILQEYNLEKSALGIAEFNLVTPTVTLNAPANNTNFTTQTITFNCSANSEIGVLNLTLFIDGSENYTIFNTTENQNLSIEVDRDLSENSHLWNCGSGSEAYAMGEERTLTIDSIPPSIDGTWNLTDLLTFSLPVNSTWNYTASDIHLADCWYNTTDNATITLITCNDTIYTQWETQGDKTLYYYANDTFGLENYSSSTITISFISLDYYHAPDVTGEGGNIFFELYVNKTNIETTTAYLFFNDTIYYPDNSNAYTDYYYFDYTFNIPDSWGNSTGKEYDYNWNYTIASVVNNKSTATDNFTIWEIAFDDCTTYGQLILNFSLKDEEGNDYINSTAGSNVEIDLALTSSDGSGSWTYHDSWSNNATGSAELDALVCMPYEILNNTNYSIDYTIGFDSTDHVWEFFYLENGTLNYHKDILNSLTNRTLPLMDLLSADSTSFLFNYFDEDGLIVDNVIVHTFRQYIGEGVFREVERSKQNDDGNTIIHLVEEDVIYYFIVSQNGTILYTSSTYTALCQTTPCEIQLEESGGFQEFTDEWDLIENGGYLITSSSLTRDVTLNYTLTSPSTMNITLYKLIGDGSYSIIGSNQSTGIQDNLVVNVPTISGNTSFFVSIEQDGTFIKSQWVDLEDDAGLYFGNVLSLFLGALIVLALGLMAVSEGSPVIIFLMLGMFLAMVLGLVDYRTSAGLSIFIYFVVAGGIIIWKLTRRNR